VIVSDNGSVDGSVEAIRERFPWVKVIENNANLGFSKANNIAVSQARAEILFILNPDTIIINGIEEMVEYIRANRKAGIVGPIILDKNNMLSYMSDFHIDSYLKLFLYLFLYKYYINKDLKKIENKLKLQMPIDIAWVSGVAMLIRKDVFNKINGFDEEFGFGFEDEDLCIRVKKSGYSMVVFPQAQIIHFGNSSFKKDPYAGLKTSGHSSIYFYKKNYSLFPSLVRLIIVLFYSFRITISVIKKVYYKLIGDEIASKERTKIIHNTLLAFRSFFDSKWSKAIKK